MNKIEVNDLTKIFGSHPQQGMKRLQNGEQKEEILSQTGMTVGVNQVSFAVKAGEFFVIMGLSGSGKSTLIRLVNRLIEPTHGEVLIDGTDIIKMNRAELSDVRRKSRDGFPAVRFISASHRTGKRGLWVGNPRYKKRSTQQTCTKIN
jgi:glycine betaine/proline transport system ATP-binding protein